MRRLFTIMGLVLGLAFIPLWASGSTRPARGPENTGLSSFSTVTSRRCDVLEIRWDERIVRVRDQATHKEMLLVIGDRTVIKARKKADFDGRKRLKFEDFAVGQELIVTGNDASGEILTVRIRG